MKLPSLFIEKMKTLPGFELEKYLESFNSPRLYGLRANTLKISPKELEDIFPGNLRTVPWCKEGFYYDGESVRPAKHPYYSAGLYYIQEPSAMSTGAVVPVSPGERVLDLCAAPGGKSTQLAARLQGEGLLVSNDISASRCKALLKNIELCGIKNALVTNSTPEKLAGEFEGFFDKIITDAPCSGEGMFRKDEGAVRGWQEHKTEVCCSLQREILHYADIMLRPGGILAYSTCTFAPEEDEGMIWEFLQKHDYTLLDFDKSTGFIDGFPEWCNGGEELKKCGRLMPYIVDGEGHFLCLLQKKGACERKLDPVKEEKIKDIEYFEDFCAQSLNVDFSGSLTRHGDSLFMSAYQGDMKGIRIMRNGLYLGEFKKKRFEPSQALAMALKRNEAKNTVSFKAEAEEVTRYLKGESFQTEAEDGFCLFCTDNYPLGWGKVKNNRLKNRYLPGWISG